MKWLSDLLTNKNGEHDIGRWSWFGSWVAIVAAAVSQAFQHGTVDLVQLAQALGIVSAAHGIGIGAKGHTE